MDRKHINIRWDHVHILMSVTSSRNPQKHKMQTWCSPDKNFSDTKWFHGRGQFLMFCQTPARIMLNIPAHKVLTYKSISGGVLYKYFPFNTFNRLCNHYSFLDGQTVRLSITARGPLHQLHATNPMDSVTHFFTEAYYRDVAARSELQAQVWICCSTW